MTNERDWKPGDVAMRSYLGGVQRSLRVAHGIACAEHHPRTDHWHHADGGWDPVAVAPAYRPLVIIDPENREQVERLLGSLQSMGFAPHACGAFTCLQSGLRSLIESPKPEEPQGLGAVIEDTEGHRWVRDGDVSMSRAWYRRGVPSCRHYTDINVAKVLSEGVSA